MSRIVVTQPVHPAQLDRLRAAGHEVVALEAGAGLGGAELVAACEGYDVLVCQLTDQVTEEVLRAGPRLVATVSAGLDHVDVAAAARHGVAVVHTPGVLTDASADLALALMLAVARHVPGSDAAVRAGTAGAWRLLQEPMGIDITGATVGIVGMGRIGLAVARRCHLGFGMDVVYTSRSRSAVAEDELGASRLGLDELLGRADVVSLHAPLTPQTEHLIRRETLALLRPHAILVNTARGGLVSEVDLAAALQAGQLAGAGLDVLEHEPEVHPDLLACGHRVVLTPHVGSATARTRLAMTRLVVDDVLAVLAGDRPRHPVAGTWPSGAYDDR